MAVMGFLAAKRCGFQRCRRACKNVEIWTQAGFMSRLVSSPQAVLDFASSAHSFREKAEAARSASGGMKSGCKRFGEALSVTSGPAFVLEKPPTLPRSRGGWNLDLSRAGVINPRNACGDDANVFPISALAGNPPAAMMLIHPSRPASVQKTTFLSARLHSAGIRLEKSPDQ